MRTTFMQTNESVERKWYIVDATDLVLGRMATDVAVVLKGKHKPTFTPHIDGGDYVIIVNAEKVALTGNKLQDKVYHHHTGYAGGIKTEGVAEILEKHPERVIMKAVERMISRNKLGRAQMTKLRVYAGAEHPHTAQNPMVLDIASKNKKNVRSL